MRYKAVDEADHFRYRDSVLQHAEQKKDDLVFDLTGVQVLPSCSQSDFVCTMKTDHMRIRLVSGKLSGGRYDAYEVAYENGKREMVPEVLFKESDLEEVWDLLRYGKNFWLSAGGYLDDTDSTRFFLDLDFQAGIRHSVTAFGRVEFTCAHVEMEWDGYARSGDEKKERT